MLDLNPIYKQFIWNTKAFIVLIKRLLFRLSEKIAIQLYVLYNRQIWDIKSRKLENKKMEKLYIISTLQKDNLYSYINILQ